LERESSVEYKLGPVWKDATPSNCENISNPGVLQSTVKLMLFFNNSNNPPGIIQCLYGETTRSQVVNMLFRYFDNAVHRLNVGGCEPLLILNNAVHI